MRAHITHTLAIALSDSPGACRDDMAEAEALLAEALMRERHALGPEHPNTISTARNLAVVRQKLAMCRP